MCELIKDCYGKGHTHMNIFLQEPGHHSDNNGFTNNKIKHTITKSELERMQQRVRCEHFNGPSMGFIKLNLILSKFWQWHILHDMARFSGPRF
jgi:hypothetical protein